MLNFGRSKKSGFLNSDTKNNHRYENIIAHHSPCLRRLLVHGLRRCHPIRHGRGLGAGGAALGGELTHNNPYAIVGGAAGGALLGEGLHAANGKLDAASYQTGYDKGRSDAVKQQYWLYVSMQQAKAGDDGRVRLYEVHLPEQVIDGVIFQPTTQFLRIEQ